MSGTFNINDRATWDWVSREVTAETPPEGDYKLDPTSPNHFYQIANGQPVRHPCPDGLVWNPASNPGPVCDWPYNVDEADIYDWAVANGVVNDQR